VRSGLHAAVSTERFEQSGRPTLTALPQAFFPALHDRPEAFPKTDQLFDATVELAEPFDGGAVDLPAREASAVANPEKRREFVERETERERLLDQVDAVEGVRWILPVAIRFPPGGGKKATAFVMAQRIDADSGSSGELTRATGARRPGSLHRRQA
jgi:hypothetical protein